MGWRAGVELSDREPLRDSVEHQRLFFFFFFLQRASGKSLEVLHRISETFGCAREKKKKYTETRKS